MKFGTKAIHAGVKPDPSTGAIMTPIYQTSTYVQKAPGKHLGYAYGRTQNPTRTALQDSLAQLENGRYGICFSSGMAALDAILRTLKPGEEVISSNDLYGGSYRLITKMFEPFGIKTHFIDMSDPINIETYINNKTKYILIETPTNPMLTVLDIAAICKIAKKYKVKVVVDNTFATPYLQNPLDLGAEVVWHSCTKYLGGHSDVIMGGVITNNRSLADKLYFIQKAAGAVPGPQDCFLMLRGIKTLHLRVQRACENALAIAKYLKAHKKVSKVYYPGLKDSPQYKLAKKQMRHFGGMVSFDLKQNKVSAAKKVMSGTKLFALAESLGGVESLIGHPASMTHASIPKEERKKVGLTDSLIRLSIGVEDVDDLLEDLGKALAKLK